MSDQATNPPASTPPPQPSPDFQRPPVGAPGGPPIPPTIPLTVDEFQRLRGIESQFAEFQKQRQAEIEAKETERLRVLAEKGQVEEAFKQHREMHEKKLAEEQARYASLESSLLSREKATVLAEALMGRSFASEEASTQLRQLLDMRFEASRNAAGQIEVREKGSLRPAADVMKEVIASPSYAHFFAASSSGGSGSDGSRPPAPPQQPPAAGSLDAIVADWKSRQGQYQSFGLNPIK